MSYYVNDVSPEDIELNGPWPEDYSINGILHHAYIWGRERVVLSALKEGIELARKRGDSEALEHLLGHRKGYLAHKYGRGLENG